MLSNNNLEQIADALLISSHSLEKFAKTDAFLKDHILKTGRQQDREILQELAEQTAILKKVLTEEKNLMEAIAIRRAEISEKLKKTGDEIKTARAYRENIPAAKRNRFSKNA